MTKTEFIKKYGARDTSVRFKSTNEIDAFLKECESFGIRWNDGQLATKYKGHGHSNYTPIRILSDERIRYDSFSTFKVAYELILTPKQMIKDGWSGINRAGKKIHFLPSIDRYVYEGVGVNNFNNYSSDLTREHRDSDIIKLYDADGTLQWTLQEKSAHDLEIERIESEMKAQAEITKKLADDLAKLKGLPY